MTRVHCLVLVVTFAVAQGTSAFAGWGHGHWGGVARSNWGWSGHTYKKSYSTTKNYSYSTPKYSKPKYSTPTYSSQSYSKPSYSTPSYSSPGYSTTPSYSSSNTVYLPKPTPRHYVEPEVIVKKVVPAKPSLHIRILCPPGEHGECAYTLITAGGSPFDYTISEGEKQTIVVKDAWKIKFRPERGEQWVGYNLVPGNTYSLQRDESGFWDLFEM